ncbi:hypothetical protein J2T08_001266 [Neorhizobium galegae]|uniref:hypothetical protein n=1 Tax=Neorhizobium galegae TaxID=399 RepID=UPI001AE80133|nr:hypothetical protein [Neorhizobium galegae]MBP2560591.1 hypothetical protein [Neorhizobium galegae]MDQ0133365.1 hypothetical protein [Neorhizobium galegae]
MNSISAVQPAALLILQQANTQPAENEDKTEEKKADLVQVANGISGEPSKETMRAAFAVNAAFIDVDEKSQLVSDAIAFIDSDKFKISDPIAKLMLKGLLSEKGWQFMQLANQQYEVHGGLTRESLFALTIPQMVAKNRELFTDDEIEIGIKFKDGGGVVVFIPDSEGNSTYRDLVRAISDEEIAALVTGNKEGLFQLYEEFGRFSAAMTKAFDYKEDEGSPMLIDIDDLASAPWIPKPPRS